MTRVRRRIRQFFLMLFVAGSLVSADARPARALLIFTDFGSSWPIDFIPVTPQGVGWMGVYQTWMVMKFFAHDILPMLMDFSQQMTTTMMDQMYIVGTLLDAKEQLQTQLLFQRLAAQAHKDYQSSTQMCEFGSVSYDLGASDFTVSFTRNTLAENQLRRNAAELDQEGLIGADSDLASRIATFKNRFCDVHDNDFVDGNAQTGFGLICTANPTAKTVDRDVDYLRTMLIPRTLDIAFADNMSDDSQDIMALGNNLYGSDQFENFDSSIAPAGANIYLDQRSIIAKRSVAETSFDAIVGLKTAGVQGSAAYPFMAALLQQLGMTPDAPDFKYFLDPSPSYLAQLEILSKLMYMRPEFYSDLYDTPANVKRRSVAMQAIGSMVDRQIFESQLRSESIMSVLLEMRIMPEEQRVYNDVGKLKADIR